MTLETPRLLLRPWRDQDAADLYALAGDPRVGPAAGWLPHPSPAHSLEIIRTVLGRPGVFALELKETGRPVGSVGLLTAPDANLPLAPGEAELGYGVGVPCWGRGLAPEAARAVLGWGFGPLALSAVWCGWYEGNRQSCRVQEKCGFRWQYTCRGAVCPAGGPPRTEQVSRLTRQEWLAGAGTPGIFVRPMKGEIALDPKHQHARTYFLAAAAFLALAALWLFSGWFSWPFAFAGGVCWTVMAVREIAAYVRGRRGGE